MRLINTVHIVACT
ncbi:hypothetical protein F383_12775 [Gossypium arboreum]|uniref:Uncharacterized protein n=1 Tax=Gossypium arboreum TaxID=29729 RepID=A0A0B0NE92_GOSAR|nr:hypothetical protein F383_12775 [Gossypium arboreum]